MSNRYRYPLVLMARCYPGLGSPEFPVFPELDQPESQHRHYYPA